MNGAVVALNFPYVASYVLAQKYMPKVVTPTFVLGLVGACLVQTALLVFNHSSIVTRFLLLYAYVFVLIFILASIATQWICGKDLLKLGRSLIK
jgi:hypothetical protein